MKGSVCHPAIRMPRGAGAARSTVTAVPVAFTLLELLIAVAIFAVVLLAMHMVFFGAVQLRNRTASTVDEALLLDQAVALLRRDLQNLVPPGGTLFGPLQSVPQTTNAVMDPLVSLNARRVSPDFYTASAVVDAWTPWGEVQKVAYALTVPTNRTEGFELVRAVTRNLLSPYAETPELQPLLSGVQDVRFEFFDGSQWLAVWDSTVHPLVLPLAIRVQIIRVPRGVQVAAEAPIELVVPVSVRPLTNVAGLSSGGGV